MSDIDGDEGTAVAAVNLRQRQPRAYRQRTMGNLCIFALTTSLASTALYSGCFPDDETRWQPLINADVAAHVRVISAVALGRWELLSLPLTTEDADFATMRGIWPRKHLRGVRGWCVFRAFSWALPESDCPKMPANGMPPLSC
jgi:hypothetical protein